MIRIKKRRNLGACRFCASKVAELKIAYGEHKKGTLDEFLDKPTETVICADCAKDFAKILQNSISICPVCDKTYTDAPALSRKDNKTHICPDCGTAEALEVYNTQN